MFFFYKFGVSFRDGSPEPTGEKTERLADHGKVRYVTEGEKKLIDRLESLVLVGVPGVILLGFLMYFVVGKEDATPPRRRAQGAG
jgi:hypothetical protein